MCHNELFYSPSSMKILIKHLRVSWSIDYVEHSHCIPQILLPLHTCYSIHPVLCVNYYLLLNSWQTNLPKCQFSRKVFLFTEQIPFFQEPSLCVHRTDTNFPGTPFQLPNKQRFSRKPFSNINEQIGNFQEGTLSKQIFQHQVSVAAFETISKLIDNQKQCIPRIPQSRNQKLLVKNRYFDFVSVQHSRFLKGKNKCTLFLYYFVFPLSEK